MDERLYEKIYQANIKLVDDNTMLKKDIEILEKRIKKANEYMSDYILREDNNESAKMGFMIAMSILNGEEKGKDIDDKELELP